MIVDAHAHVAAKGMLPDRYIEEIMTNFARANDRPIPDTAYDGIDPEGMMDEYRAAGVDKVFIFATAPRVEHTYGRNPRTRARQPLGVPNEYVAEVHRQFPDITVPVMAVSPPLLGDRLQDEVEYAVKELGAKAIKIYPTYDHYRPDDRELCWPLYEALLELDTPLIVHQSWTPSVHAPMKMQSPIQLDDVAREFRDLTITLAHFGAPWVEDAMCLVAKHDNVYTDLSFYHSGELPHLVLQTLLRCPGYGCSYDRILWGTDYPLIGPAGGLAVFREKLPLAAERMGLPMIPDEAVDMILGGNAARLYSLEEPAVGAGQKEVTAA